MSRESSCRASLSLSSRTPPSNTASHLIHTRSLKLMISWVSSSLIDEIRRCSTELRPLALEAEVRDACDVLVAIAKVVGKEEHQLLNLAKQRPLNGDFLNIARLR